MSNVAIEITPTIAAIETEDADHLDETRPNPRGVEPKCLRPIFHKNGLKVMH